MTTTLDEMYEITVLLRQQHPIVQENIRNRYKEDPQRITKELLASVRAFRILKGVFQD